MTDSTHSSTMEFSDDHVTGKIEIHPLDGQITIAIFVKPTNKEYLTMKYSSFIAMMTDFMIDL